MIVAFSQLHKLYKNDFPSSLQKSPPKIRAPWWLTLGRKEGQRIQQVEPVLSEQPEAFPAHLKLRLSPRDLRAPGGRHGPTHLWHPEARHCFKGRPPPEGLQCGTCGWRATIKAASWEWGQEAGLQLRSFFSKARPGKRPWALAKWCSRFRNFPS